MRSSATFGALLAVSAACAVVALLPATAPRPSMPAHDPGTATPVLTASRAKPAVTDLASAVHLDARLAGVVAAAGPTSCMQVDVGGAPVFAARTRAALLPASNLKLLTATAALARLGAGATLATVVRAGRPPVRGVVDGPLWMVGGGDPLLVTPGYRATQHEWTWSSEPGTALASLADKIVAAGVRVVRGGVVGDDSRYDTMRALPSWRPSYLADGQIGAVGALVVDGGFAGPGRNVPAPVPALVAAGDLAALLRARGVAVLGPPAAGPAPASSAPLASVSSLPLGQMVGVMLRESDNLSAEMLVKELGARFGGGGTWSAGLAVVRQTLAGMGLPLASLVMNDGSGLDRGDRATCALLVGTLEHGSAGDPVIAGLPVAGRSGTLVGRLGAPLTAVRLRAKTGSLVGVAALTGVITPLGGSGPPAVFSLVSNSAASEAGGRALEDAVADVLATYPDAGSP